MRILKAIAVILMFTSTVCFAASFEDGLSHYGKGDYKSAHTVWLPIAQKGDSSAQYYLGQMYLKGQGTNKDVKLAYAWLTVASKGGMDLATDLLDDLTEDMSTVQIDEAGQLASSLAH